MSQLQTGRCVTKEEESAVTARDGVLIVWSEQHLLL
jgi:hypothetical protein